MDILSCCSWFIGPAVRMSILLIAIPILSYVSKFISMMCAQRFSRHIGVLVEHIIFYGGIIFIGVNILHEFGFNIAALLGAAGVVGVAIGFASQTSISNIISGFFLLLERPFTVGDTIKSGDVIGIAESVDLLAVRVRTRDNKLVRIPNEMVLKQSLTNLTYYPIKRIDVMLSVSYEKDLEAVIGQIRNLIAQDKLFLTHPAPVILISKIGQLDYDSQIRSFLSIRVWVATDKFTYATSVLIGQIKNEFEDDTVTVMPIN